MHNFRDKFHDACLNGSATHIGVLDIEEDLDERGLDAD